MTSSRILSGQRLESVLATNTVLRNTYILLGLTMLFSALTAGIAMLSSAPPLNPFITLIGYLGFLFLTNALRNSGWGLLSVFGLTGFMGYTLGIYPRPNYQPLCPRFFKRPRISHDVTGCHRAYFFRFVSLCTNYPKRF